MCTVAEVLVRAPNKFSIMFFASLQVAAMGLSTLNVTARRFHIANSTSFHTNIRIRRICKSFKLCKSE